MRPVLGVHWKDWCWGWNSNTLATSCEELTHWKRPWCWEGLGAGGEGDDRGWDGWTTSLTWWTWVWVNSGSWWWTGRPGVLQFMGSQRVEHDWVTELNWLRDKGEWRKRVWLWQEGLGFLSDLCLDCVYINGLLMMSYHSYKKSFRGKLDKIFTRSLCFTFITAHQPTIISKQNV